MNIHTNENLHDYKLPKESTTETIVTGILAIAAVVLLISIAALILPYAN